MWFSMTNRNSSVIKIEQRGHLLLFQIPPAENCVIRPPNSITVAKATWQVGASADEFGEMSLFRGAERS